MFEKLMRNPETKRILIYLGGAGILAILAGTFYAAAMNAVTPSRITTNAAQGTPPGAEEVRLKGERIRVTIVDTPESRARGLSGRSGLAESEGMLFVFPEEGKYGFWMKDMRFSIDILWLDSDGEIVHIERRVSPESYPASFLPSRPARYVLELSAGWAEAHDVSIGDRVTL